MSATYKVRMTVLAMISANTDREAESVAMDMAEDAGLTILQTEEPERVAIPGLYHQPGADDDRI